jgi:hypothetical protein
LLAARVEGPLEFALRSVLAEALERVPAALLAFAGCDRGEPPDVGTVRRALAERGLTPAFVGRSPDGAAPAHRHRAAVVAVLDPDGGSPPTSPAPDGFRVAAIMPVYNEEDVIAQTLRYLVEQGVDVHLVDNWSTDATVDRARAFLERGVTIERFPPGAPSSTYDLRALLDRVETVAEQLSSASWVMLHDADERRLAPWPGVSLRDALWHVERSGYSCVDHVTMNFWPVGGAFDPDGPDIEEQLRHFEFSAHAGHFHQRRAWKQLGHRASLVASAGHDVAFPGRRVYPYRFLMKHYPIRSRAHGERKLEDRARRWNAEERAMGWHRQYDGFTPRDASTMHRFDPSSFYEEFVIERLSAAGVFHEPPPWATSPRW